MVDWKKQEPMMWHDGYEARKNGEPRAQEFRGPDPLAAEAAWLAGYDTADKELLEDQPPA